MENCLIKLPERKEKGKERKKKANHQANSKLLDPIKENYLR